MIKIAKAGLVALAVSGSALSAFGQGTDVPPPVVTEAPGTNDVVVVRGGQTYILNVNDPLFEGDRVVTRAASAKISSEALNCSQNLPANSTIVIGKDFCNLVVASADQTILASTNTVTPGAAPVAGAGGVGTALPIIGALAAAGGAAAAAGGGGSTSQ